MRKSPLTSFGVTPAVKAPGPLVTQPPGAGLGVSTIQRGSKVVKAGVDYVIASISKTGVVKLNTLQGAFAMYSHVSVCKVL